MSGKPQNGKAKAPTLTEKAEMKAEVARLRAAWSDEEEKWTLDDVEAYLLRIGLNRHLALERYGKAKAKQAKSKKKAEPKRTRTKKVAKATAAAA